MNNQEAFNKVCAHLKQQGTRSMTDDGACAYAGDDGRACAVGCLLPREIGESLDTIVNDTSWSGILNAADRGDEQAVEASALLSGVEPRLLKHLQSAHDDADDSGSPEEFWGSAKSRLLAIADGFSLELPPELQS